MNKENTIIFTKADEIDIINIKKTGIYPFGDSDIKRMPRRPYNRVIIKTSDGSGRNVIGYVKEVTEWNSQYEQTIWGNKKHRRDWYGVVVFDKVKEVSDDVLNLISDTMKPKYNKLGHTMYTGRNTGGAFGYCESYFKNL